MIKRGFMWFEVIVIIIWGITAFFYGSIGGVLWVLLHIVPNNRVDDNIFFFFLVFFIYLAFPLPLAIKAHKNKRNIEKYFHLFYMVFAPILFLLLYENYNNATKDIDSIVFLTMIIFILSISFLFLLRNLYLWYRDSKDKRNLKESTIITKEEILIRKITGTIMGMSIGGAIGASIGGIIGISAIGAMLGAMLGTIAGVAVELINLYDKQ